MRRSFRSVIAGGKERGAASTCLSLLFWSGVIQAAGAVITFTATYALGHVAEQYYAQGRRLSADDLRALFARFQDEAKTIYPRVQTQIQRQAGTLNLQSLLRGLSSA